ncbi:hypothetical protein L0Z11_12555 [Burkholderia multivorans]|uniref:hypothetical protein n=1 Tax=Burkholderia multivorans TaxID=87883 RepID=UPI0020185CBF|nr:hypothetical protein [Burkholderia multivorans]UQN68510.1 hypothetical protein L0Z45_12575 [Burkholderia multivorans]UQN74237.1 hypothetical protein L0Z11_12555 [Burkholderia multivorans]
MSWRSNIDAAVKRMRKAIARRIAALWQHTYRAQYQLGVWKLRYGNIAFYAVLLLLVSASAYLSPVLQNVLASYYLTGPALESLRSLILNVGSALIGAAAIVTSLVLFAMQVNIERMPHGLFRRLSGDLKLLGAFALAFLLAIGVAALSTFVDKARLAHVVLATFWAVVFILISFMYAYRRALSLINPLRQLGILIHDTRKELRTWARRAQRAMPLLEREESASATSSSTDSTHDLARTAFFQINNRWTDGAKRAIRHAMSFARRYAEQGDYEVSGAALSAVVGINAAYIESKGKTFYANNPFVDNPLSSDSFFNDTLEHMRQNAQSGIARRDEQQIEQTLQAMAALVQVYLSIDYSSPYATKSHAQLATGYLAGAVQAVVPHDMVDVLLEGQRLMGQSAQYVLAHGDPNDIAVLSEKIALIACTGCAKEDYRPVTMEGVRQLANLTFDLLRSRSRDIHFAVGEVRRDVALLAKLFLNVPDTPLSSSHSTFLGPYYSSTSMDSLRARLTALANAISEAQPDNADAQSVIRNIERWADGLYQTEKELLLAAIQAKSHFAFDMIHWITGVTEILLAVSNAPACDHHSQEELRKHARWLIATLTWIPDNKESVTFVENFQMTETLFEAAIDARNRGCDEIAKEIGESLLSWTFKGGKYQTGWGILEKGLCGLAAFALMAGDEQVSEFRTALAAHLSRESAPAQEIRERAAREILERAESLYRQGHWSSRIDMAIDRSDHEKLRPLLEEIAGLLSPGMAHQTPTV